MINMEKTVGIIGMILVILAAGYYVLQHNETRIGKQVIKTKTEKQVVSFLKNEKYQIIELNDKGYFQYKLTEKMLGKEPEYNTAFNLDGSPIDEH